MKDKVEKIKSHLNQSILEREREIEQILAAIFAGQHVFLIGVPGTAKSYLTRKVFECFKDVNTFEKLLTKTTKPQEIFGPISLSALKQDKMRFNTKGMMPGAHFAFLDEIWKSSSAILNNFLTILEEGIFQNGEEVVKTPLKSMVCASNELPQEDILQALYDRLVLRLEVKKIQSRENFKKLMRGDFKSDSLSEDELLTLEDLDNIQSQIKQVDTTKVEDTFFDLRMQIQEDSQGRIFISDRHFKKAFKFLKAMMWMKGKTSATKDDLIYLENVLWSDPQDRDVILSSIQSFMSQTVSRAQKLYNEIDAAIDVAMKADSQDDFIDAYMVVEDKLSDLEEYKVEQDNTDYGPSVDEIFKKAEDAAVQIRDEYRKRRR